MRTTVVVTSLAAVLLLPTVPTATAATAISSASAVGAASSASAKKSMVRCRNYQAAYAVRTRGLNCFDSKRIVRWLYTEPDRIKATYRWDCVVQRRTFGRNAWEKQKCSPLPGGAVVRPRWKNARGSLNLKFKLRLDLD